MAWKCARCGNTGSPNPPGVMGLTLLDNCILCRTEADPPGFKIVKKDNRQTIANIAKVARIAKAVRKRGK